MENRQKVAPFAAFKPFLHILTIYDPKNFQNGNRREIVFKRCQAFAFSVVCCAFSIAAWFSGAFCLEHNFNVTEFSFQIAVFINSLQLTITYMSIRIDNDRVSQVIDNIGTTVAKREYSIRDTLKFVKCTIDFQIQ